MWRPWRGIPLYFRMSDISDKLGNLLLKHFVTGPNMFRLLTLFTSTHGPTVTKVANFFLFFSKLIIFFVIYFFPSVILLIIKILFFLQSSQIYKTGCFIYLYF